MTISKRYFFPRERYQVLITGLKRRKWNLPVSLGLDVFVGPEVLGAVPRDDAQIDCASGSHVVFDTGGDGIPHQMLGCLQLHDFKDFKLVQ